MNPFVNPNKRSVTLPEGCKDLMDVLKLSGSKHDEAIHQFIRSLLSTALPKGSKNLMDVQKYSESNHGEAIREFIRLFLLTALYYQATELVIGVSSPSGETPVRYRVKETWYDLAPFPSDIRPKVIVELARMAKFPTGNLFGTGGIELDYGVVPSKWTVAMTSAEGECRITRVQD